MSKADPTTTKSTASSSLTDVITDPDAALRKRAENPGLLRPMAIVFLAAVATVIGPFLTYQAFVNAGAPPLASFSLAGSILFAFFGQFVAWFLFAVVFYVLSIAVGGEGSFGDTLKLNGWGFIPAIFAGIVFAVAQFMALQNVAVPDLPADFTGENAAQFVEALTEFQMAIQSEPAVRVAMLIGILLTVWQGIIWLYATKHARNLTFRGAAIAVGIPVGLLVLVNLNSLLSGWVF